MAGSILARKVRSPFWKPHVHRFVDLNGQRFGRLTVLAFAGRTPKGEALWRCRCECGRERVVLAYNLRSGGSQSCGCLARELSSKRRLRHGECRKGRETREHLVWRMMKARCSNPHNKDFMDYGGRGIRICARWLHSFPNFLADVGRKPSPAHSIDRKDNDGHYSCGHCPECVKNGWPANCRWATATEQRMNQRRMMGHHRKGKA
ncbi:MAG: hypothetical protein FD189_1080 [Elusimicrobia bacterium]|nr:MAG: hypothetical protein FD189_1080 [Elusimicrobiota bacterium]